MGKGKKLLAAGRQGEGEGTGEGLSAFFPVLGPWPETASTRRRRYDFIRPKFQICGVRLPLLLDRQAPVGRLYRTWGWELLRGRLARANAIADGISVILING